MVTLNKLHLNKLVDLVFNVSFWDSLKSDEHG